MVLEAQLALELMEDRRLMGMQIQAGGPLLAAPALEVYHVADSLSSHITDNLPPAGLRELLFLLPHKYTKQDCPETGLGARDRLLVLSDGKRWARVAFTIQVP